MGFGEDLPAGVAMQRAGRRTPELLRANESERGKAMIARYANIARPALFLTFTDDAFATERGARHLVSSFPRFEAKFLTISPADVRMKAIGHFGFFRPAARSWLWPIVTQHLLNGNAEQ